MLWPTVAIKEGKKKAFSKRKRNIFLEKILEMQTRWKQKELPGLCLQPDPGILT